MQITRLFFATLIAVLFSTASVRADDTTYQPMVAQQFFVTAKQNTNWKMAFATAKSEQIVFMNISPQTNPANEIGMEVHAFDQVIIIVEGTANAILNDKSQPVQKGDMIFIPEGTHHNVVNTDANNPLKLVSFYSSTDIPSGSVYATKADEPANE